MLCWRALYCEWAAEYGYGELEDRGAELKGRYCLGMRVLLKITSQGLCCQGVVPSIAEMSAKVAQEIKGIGG